MTDETTALATAVSDEAPPAPPAEAPPTPADHSEGPTPYRSVEMAPAAEPRVSRGMTLWGPVLSIFGVLLWAFVVMGQLVTTYAPGRHELLLGEATGVLFVLGASMAAWLRAVRHSLRVSPVNGRAKRVERALSLGILALIGWGVAMGVAMVIGRAVSDGSTTFLMLFIAAGAFFYGRRLLGQSKGSQPQARSIVAIALWAGAGLITLVALVTLGAD